MKPGTNSALLVLVVAVLFSGLVLLIYMTQDKIPGLRSQVVEQLRDIKQFDAQVNLHVLRLKDDLDHNYDTLTGLQASLNKAQESLIELAQLSADDSLDKPTQELKDALLAKIELVEAFKTQNSIMRNSMRYLPQAAQALENMAYQPTISETILGAIRNTTGRLVTNIWYFTQVHDEVAKKRVGETLLRLDALNQGRSGPIANQVKLLVLHGRVILRQSGKMQDLLFKMFAVPTAFRTNELWQQYEKVFEEATAARDNWRMGLIAYSIMLLILLAVASVKLIQSYRSLEQRVTDRTRELSEALEHLKESQLQLVQASKMASLGQMVAGIAHEINTPLAYINSGLQVAGDRMADVDLLVKEAAQAMRLLAKEDTKEEDLNAQFAMLDEITTAFVEMDVVHELETLMADGQHGIEQISDIIANLKNFSRLDRSRIDRLNVNDGIHSTLKIAHNIVKKRDVKTLLGDVPEILCSPSQINQILLNLITNACQATPEGGRIFIVSRKCDDFEGVCIDIVDNGSGIDAETQDKIFDPFFTTKKVGEGTGLGLSIVYRIVKQHGGEISVNSRPGMGTKFSVQLPLSAPLDDDETSMEGLQ